MKMDSVARRSRSGGFLAERERSPAHAKEEKEEERRTYVGAACMNVPRERVHFKVIRVR